MGSTDKVDATTLAWFPNESVRADFYEKARKRGLEIIEGMF